MDREQWREDLEEVFRSRPKPAGARERENAFLDEAFAVGDEELRREKSRFAAGNPCQEWCLSDATAALVSDP